MNYEKIGKAHHIELCEIFGRVVFLSIRPKEVEIGMGVHSVMFGLYPTMKGFYTSWV